MRSKTKRSFNMLELMKMLIALKYSCKNNHWKTNSYSAHLLYDRLQEDIDDMVDDIAEKYFMSFDKQNELGSDILSGEITENVTQAIEAIIKHVETMADSSDYDEGMTAMITSMSENLHQKRTLSRMK